ncbi:MAG TPA: hypothetical protein VFX59_24930 [Polyangiales bacterium]|nr:hypothetical protein [Polyangiales bacterium]
MAKVQIKDDSVDIEVSLLERVMLAERPRKLPLSRIRSVDPHPPLLDMMVHWSDQSGVWLCGVSAYDGHMVPSSRHPQNTLAIELEGDDAERIYVEVDDESPHQVAERIERALGGAPRESSIDATPRRDSSALIMKALEVEYDDDLTQLRDPLMQGSLPAPAMHDELAVESDRDLSRLGGWLVGLGSIALVGGGVLLATGALPGLLAVGAGVTCAALGGIALAVVAHHQE